MLAPAGALAVSQPGRRLLGDVPALPQRRVGLRGELEHIPAVGEHGRLVGKHHRDARHCR